MEEVPYHVAEAVLVDSIGRRRAGLAIAQFAEGDLLSLTRPDLEQVLRSHLPAAVDLRYGATLVGVTPRDDGSSDAC